MTETYPMHFFQNTFPTFLYLWHWKDVPGFESWLLVSNHNMENMPLIPSILDQLMLIFDSRAAMFEIVQVGIGIV